MTGYLIGRVPGREFENERVAAAWNTSGLGNTFPYFFLRKQVAQMTICTSKRNFKNETGFMWSLVLFSCYSHRHTHTSLYNQHMWRISTVCAVKEQEVGGRDYTFYYNFSSKSEPCHLSFISSSISPSFSGWAAQSACVRVCVCVYEGLNHVLIDRSCLGQSLWLQHFPA